MENIFEKSNMFATPESVEALQEFVQQFNGPDRKLAVTVMAMTWNLAHEELAKALKKEETR